MDKAVDLICSMFDVTSSQDVCFCQPQYTQYTHHGLSFVLLCVPVLFSDNVKCQFLIVWCGFPGAVLAIMLSPVLSIATRLIAEMHLVLFCSAVQQVEHT